MAIDGDRLPYRAAVDTGILIRALEPELRDAAAEACRQFWDGMIEEHNEILVPAPALAEVLRGSRPVSVPRTRGVLVVSFDAEAAVIIGTRMPYSETVAKAPEGQRTCMKYDQMIVACALRWGAEVLVTLDRGLADMARTAGLRAASPMDYLDAQARFETEGRAWDPT